MSQTCQCNDILLRCAKGPRDVQNAARTAEKNATILTSVCLSGGGGGGGGGRHPRGDGH